VALGGFDLPQERVDVDAAMLRREGPEAPRGLLELALEPRAVSAAGLVPGDDDVHEALEEVLLVRLRRAPCVLERLVCGEVLAPPGQVEACFEVRLRP
jgi:hypothetical protein